MSLPGIPKVTSAKKFFLIIFNAEMFKPVFTFSLNDIILLDLYAGVSFSICGACTFKVLVFKHMFFFFKIFEIV